MLPLKYGKARWFQEGPQTDGKRLAPAGVPARHGGFGQAAGRTVALVFLLPLFCLLPFSRAQQLKLGFSQEVGYDGHVRYQGRSDSDVYSKSIFRIGLGHPALALDGKFVFDPIVGISYIKFAEFTELDTVGYDIRGPLTLQIEGFGDAPDSLRLAANMKRGISSVSVGTPDQAVSTHLLFSALYTRHWRSPRWKSELGYHYDRESFEDEHYQDRDGTTHTFSAVVLYGLNRAVDVGLRTDYEMEVYKEDIRLDSDTWKVQGVVRWKITGKVKSAFSLGQEFVSYENDDDDSGVTAQGTLDYQVTPRWHCRGRLRRGFDPADRPGRTGETTTTGDLRIAYRFTPKLTGSVTPGWKSQSGDNEVQELTLDVGATYAFHYFDLTVETGVLDRSSDRGGDDEYTAMNALIRVDVDF